VASWLMVNSIYVYKIENEVSSSSEKSKRSNEAHIIVCSRIQFVKLKICIIWFK
jgi:hypothetical protein